MVKVGLVLVAAVLVASTHAQGAVDLEARFLHPPPEARPWVYWFWMNGNITRDGITADLEAMQRVGVGGALMMGVGLRTPPGGVVFNSPWPGMATLSCRTGCATGCCCCLTGTT